LDRWPIPPPPEYKEPKLRQQLRSAALPLLAVGVIINLIIGWWLWRVWHSGHAGSRVAICMGLVGLVSLDLLGVGLALFVRLNR